MYISTGKKQYIVFQGAIYNIGNLPPDLTAFKKCNILFLLGNVYYILNPVLSFKGVQGFFLPCSYILTHYPVVVK
jgi:hypothetical protein